MSDNRHRRKRPVGVHLTHSTLVRVDADDLACATLHHTAFSGRSQLILFDRGQARALRDWLNHFLEYAAQQ